jgi:hypothetical protein
MERTAIAVACVALLAVTAGCAGLFGEGGEPTDAAADGDAAAFPAAIEDHEEVLRAAGNFTYQRTRQVGQVRGDALPGEKSVRYAVDFDKDRCLRSLRLERMEEFGVERYQHADRVYVTTDAGGDGPTLVNRTGSTGILPERRVANLISVEGWSFTDFRFEPDGTATFDGETMTRYTATDPGGFRNASTVDPQTITSFHATALVDDRGVVRKVSYTLRGELASGASFVDSLTMTITDVGDTTVPEPEGVAGASAGR